jgi:hypothetical protein
VVTPALVERCYRERKSAPEVLARVPELGWSTEEWLLRGNWNQRWASICNVHFLGVPDRVLARSSKGSPNALRVARRKARTAFARHTAYVAINMLGLCEPARLPESVVPVLENAIDGESFAPVVRQVAGGLLMVSALREHRLSAARLLRQAIAETGDDDEGRLESFASSAECEGTPGVENEHNERYVEWWKEIAKLHF